MSKSELDDELLLAHVKYCPVCREIMLDLTEQARQAEMPSLDDKALEEE